MGQAFSVDDVRAIELQLRGIVLGMRAQISQLSQAQEDIKQLARNVFNSINDIRIRLAELISAAIVFSQGVFPAQLPGPLPGTTTKITDPGRSAVFPGPTFSRFDIDALLDMVNSMAQSKQQQINLLIADWNRLVGPSNGVLTMFNTI